MANGFIFFLRLKKRKSFMSLSHVKSNHVCDKLIPNDQRNSLCILRLFYLLMILHAILVPALAWGAVSCTAEIGIIGWEFTSEGGCPTSGNMNAAN